MVIEKLIPDLYDKITGYLDPISKHNTLVVNKKQMKSKKIPKTAFTYFLENSKNQAKNTQKMEKTVQNVRRATEEYQNLINQIDAYLEHFFQTRELFLRWFKNDVEKLLHAMTAYAAAVKSLDLRNNEVSGVEEMEQCLDAMHESHIIVVNTFTYNFPRWVEFMGVDASDLRQKFAQALQTD
jgi:hypothetical protein